MFDRPALPPGPWLVVGLARSGLAAMQLLHGRGERVVGVDAGSPTVPAGFDVRLGDDGLAAVGQAAVVVKSPGVSPRAPVIVEAVARGLPVIGELELAWRLLPNPFWAVTGTNGKTTTVELLGAMVEAAGLPVTVAGNVGRPLSGLVGAVCADTIVICEASSYQLEDAVAFAPEAAALLNLEPDHLDRHGTMAAYTAAKRKIFAEQRADAVAVLASQGSGADVGGAAQRVTVGVGGDLDDRDGALWWHGTRLLGHEEIRMRGAHNRANAGFAAAIALDRGIPMSAVIESLTTFKGVEHRLERVTEIDGVIFINDSKATNVASTLVALQAVAEQQADGAGVHLILGGQGKGQDFTPLREKVTTCAGRYLIGADAERLAEEVGGEVVGDLDHAVAAAANRARAGDIVLLSPACASFDQFPDFEARGDHFKELVAARRTLS